jgi:hypothetical protein
MIGNCPQCHKQFVYSLIEAARLSRVVFPLRSIFVICQECEEKEVSQSETVKCSVRGCVNEVNGFSQYCNACCDEKFQFN